MLDNLLIKVSRILQIQHYHTWHFLSKDLGSEQAYVCSGAGRTVHPDTLTQWLLFCQTGPSFGAHHSPFSKPGHLHPLVELHYLP